MGTLMSLLMMFLSTHRFPYSSWVRGLEGIELYSQITYLYVELRDLAGVGHSYCVFLYSSPLN